MLPVKLVYLVVWFQVSLPLSFIQIIKEIIHFIILCCLESPHRRHKNRKSDDESEESECEDSQSQSKSNSSSRSSQSEEEKEYLSNADIEGVALKNQNSPELKRVTSENRRGTLYIKNKQKFEEFMVINY